MAHPAEQATRADPEARRDDEPEDPAKKIAVVNLPDTRNEQAEHRRNARVISLGHMRKAASEPSCQTDRRRASSNVSPPNSTNITVPIIAKRSRPVPAKYTATVIDATAMSAQQLTSAADGFGDIVDHCNRGIDLEGGALAPPEVQPPIWSPNSATASAYECAQLYSSSDS